MYEKRSRLENALVLILILNPSRFL